MFRAYEDYTVVRPVVESDLDCVSDYRNFSEKAARKRRFVSLQLILIFIVFIGLDTYALNRMTVAGGTSTTYTSAD